MARYKLRRQFDVSEGSYGGNQMWHSKPRLVKTGCGPVALTNIFAYHLGLKLTQAEMTRLQEEITEHLHGPVVMPLQFILGAKKLFKAYGFVIATETRTCFLHRRESYANILALIRHSITLDRPVALLTGPNRLFRQTVYMPEFKNHWVLITDLDSDPRTGGNHVGVSSWGEHFRVDLEQLAGSKMFISVVSLIIPGASGNQLALEKFSGKRSPDA